MFPLNFMSFNNSFWLPGFFTPLLSLAALVFWAVMIIDCIKRNFKNNAEKIIWIGLMILGSFLASLVYFFVIKQTNPEGLIKSEKL